MRDVCVLLRRALAVFVCSLGVLGFSSCASGTPAGSGTTATTSDSLAAGGAKYLYLLGSGSSGFSVLQLSAAGGSATPVSSITLPPNFSAFSVAVDSAGAIYVGGLLGLNADAAEVLTFVPGAGGTYTATNVLNGYKPGGYPAVQSFTVPNALAVDSSGQLYIASGGSVSVFAAGATGYATPLRYFTEATASLLQISLDASGNIYVAGDNTVNGSTLGYVAEFGPTTNGTNVTPIKTMLSSTGVGGVTLDTAGNVYVTSPTSVEKFAAGAINSPPVTTISGTNTGLTNAQDVKVDAAGNLYIVNTTPAAGATVTPNVLAFGPTATGNVAPAVTLASATWGAGYTGTLAIQ